MKLRTLLILLFVLYPFAGTAQYTTASKKAEKLYADAKDHFTFQRYDEAEKCSKQAIKKDPEFVEAYYLLSGVYAMKNMPDMSLTVLEQCATLNGSKYIMSYYYWATELLNHGYYAKAAEQLDILRKHSNLLRESQRSLVENYYQMSPLV